MNTIKKKQPNHFRVKTVLLQIAVLFLALIAMVVWQYDTVYQIYVANQVSNIGWIINAGIAILFLTGLFELIKRFLEYSKQQEAIRKLVINIDNDLEPLENISLETMIAQRFITLKNLAQQHSEINPAALASTLQANESSRNSFMKFVHNVLILTGVFGTIISLSIALFGASDLLTVAPGVDLGKQNQGLSVMIYGMSTALSTTLSAITAYLFFGYFYIKLVDMQTFLLSKTEETANTVLTSYLGLDKTPIDSQYIQSLEKIEQLIDRLDRSQQVYAESVSSLQKASTVLVGHIETVNKEQHFNDDMVSLLQQMVDQQQQTNQSYTKQFEQISLLLQHGFRLNIQDTNSD